MLRRAFVAGASAWALTLPAAAFAASRPHAGPLWYAFALGAYAVGSAVCHQLPVRSFHLGGTPLPVCARCTGIYVGAALAAIAGAAVRLKPVRLKPDPTMGRLTTAWPMDRSRAMLLAAFVPTALTLAYEWTTGDMPSNWIRAAAGLPIGVAVAAIVAAPLGRPSGSAVKVN